MSSDYFDIRAYLEAGTAAKEREAWGIPTVYDGTRFRSRLEAGWASTLNRYGIRWEYEKELATLASGRRYLPDFRLPELGTVIEAKGPHMQRLDKVREYAQEALPGTLVIIGYPAQRRSMVPFLWDSYMQWGNPLGFTVGFTECGKCRAWQWCCPRMTVNCRKCGERLYGSLAQCGEMRFDEWQEPPLDLFANTGAT